MPSFFQNLFKKDSDESAMETPEGRTAGVPESNPKSAMNPTSPFAVSSEEHFTARELSMLLPPKLVRTDGVSGDQPVRLPLDLLKSSLQQGRPALRLSQIYVACPFLFLRPVQPAEDMEIVLPFQKVKRMVEPAGTSPAASPFLTAGVPSQTGAPKIDSPFAPPFPQNGAPVVAPGASPFAVRGPAGPAALTPESTFPARGSDNAAREDVLSPFASDQSTPAESSPNPFQRMEPPAAAPLRTVASPFSLASHAVPAGRTADQEPTGAVAHVLPRSGTPQLESPFSRGGNGNDKAQTAPVPALPAGRVPLPFTGPVPVRPEPLPAVPKPAETESANATAETPPAGEQKKTLKVPLAALLRDVTAHDLGFDPSAVPSNVDAELSFDTILPQLATGRVEVGVEELRQGVVERFRPALARVRPDVRFVVPLSSIFQNLPPSAIPVPQSAEHVSITTTPFQTPFAIKADEDQSRIQLPALPPAPPASAVNPLPPVAPVPPMAPFPVAPVKAATAPISLSAGRPLLESAPSPPAPVKLPGLPTLPQLPAAPLPQGRPSPFARPPGSQTGPAPEVPAPLPPSPPVMAPRAVLPKLPAEESHEDLGHPFSAESLQAEPPSPAPAPAPEPFDPAKLFPTAPQLLAAPQPVRAPTPVPARPASAGVAHGPPVEFNFGECPDLTRLTLRALFMTDENPTPQAIVDFCARLDGVRSCLAIAGRSVITAGHDSTSEDVRHFAANAPRAHESLAGLAESMGFEGNGSFTLRSATTVRTFMIERGICLAVLHGQGDFAPGVRDRLLLTARLLADIVD